MHFILILPLFISHSLKCVFLFLCMISLINRARHDRDLFYKEHLAISNLFLRWPELVNLACSILVAPTFLEAFQVWAQTKMLLFWNVRGNLASVWGGTRMLGIVFSQRFARIMAIKSFIGVCFYAPFEIKRNIRTGSLLFLSVFITLWGANSNAPQFSI